MAVKIRLKRTGKRGQPSYRLVVMEEGRPRDSRMLADLGHYSPLQEELEVKTGEALKWLQRGAQVTDSARSLLRKKGVMAELHRLRKGNAS